MSEKFRTQEPVSIDPYETFESMVTLGEWTDETEEKLRRLLETHESDMYMLYLSYVESGIAKELEGPEKKMFEVLKEVFEESAE